MSVMYSVFLVGLGLRLQVMKYLDRGDTKSRSAMVSSNSWCTQCVFAL